MRKSGKLKLKEANCVMLKLCLRIACSHAFLSGALPEPTLEVVWIARYFFCPCLTKGNDYG